MAKSIVIKGYTFRESPSGGVLITGPGLPNNAGFGIQVTSDIANLTPIMIQGLGNVPGVPPDDAAVLASFTQADVDSIKTALIPPPPAPPAPPPLEPTPPVVTEQQNKTYVAGGGANDDNPVVNQNAIGATQDEAAAINQALADDAEIAGASALTTAATPTGTASSTTVAGKSDTPVAKKDNKPGRRTKNPLSNFSSFTYKISLYMITPDAYNAFITSGRKDINAIANVANTEYAQQSYSQSSSGVYLIAQSGGINNENNNRAPGFDLDYYIDNLQISSVISMGKSTIAEGSVNTNNFKFQIIEPYGFSFITKLKNAQNALQQYVSSLPNVGSNPFADKQHYIIGIKFLGYDSQGNVVNNSPSIAGNRPNQSGTNGSFETFYDVRITEIKFKLDGRATVYDITAIESSIQEGMGIKSGRILTDTTVVGSTVGETIDSLITELNKSQVKLQNEKGCEIPTKYKVVYLGEEANLIKNASVVNTLADSDKSKFPVPTNPNISSSINANPDGNKRQLVFKGAGSTSIVQALQTIVTQSEYIQKAILNLYRNETEPDRQTKDYQTADENSNKTLKWVNISAEVKNLGYDRRRKDWSYEITYIIQPYSTPFVNVTVAPNVTQYYGPVKRYEYWLTGKNSEVLRFELVYNQLYTTVAIANLDRQKDITSPIPIMVGHRVEAPRQGRLGPALESQNAYVNNLNDPGAYATAKITIMGDPDWLVQNNSASDTALGEIYDKFYGINGYTINCNNGQVFIEIDIKEAIDYDNYTGTMSINDKILFFDYPKIYKEGPNKIEGISFQVQDVVSNFRGGKFEQTLTLIAGMWADTNASSPSTTAAERETQSRENFRRLERNAASQGGTDNTTTPAGTKTKGFPDEPPAPGMQKNTETGDWYNPISNMGAPVTGQQTSPTGAARNRPVADDDASSKPVRTVSSSDGRPPVNLSDIPMA